MNLKRIFAGLIVSAGIAYAPALTTSVARADGGMLYDDANVSVGYNIQSDSSGQAYLYANVSTDVGRLDWYSVTYTPSYSRDSDNNIIIDPRRGYVSLNFSGANTPATSIESWRGHSMNVDRPPVSIAEFLGAEVAHQYDINTGAPLPEFWSDMSGSFQGTFAENGDSSGYYRDHVLDPNTGHYLWYATVQVPVIFPEGADMTAMSFGVPEPASLSLLSMTGIALLRRRR